MANNTIKKVCKVCGDEFECSKFNPYFDACPACRKDPTKKLKQKRLSAEHEAVCEFMRQNPDYIGRFCVPGKNPKVDAHTYWIFAYGWYKKVNKDMVYHWGEKMGLHIGNNLHEIMESAV